MEKAVWGAIIAIIGTAIVSGVHDAYKDAQIEAKRKNGTLPPRWTDKNRWEKD